MIQFLLKVDGLALFTLGVLMFIDQRQRDQTKSDAQRKPMWQVAVSVV